MTIDGDLADTSIAVSNIQSDNLEGGRLAGERMAKLIGGKGTRHRDRQRPRLPDLRGAREGLQGRDREVPGIKYLGMKYTNNEVAEAANIVSTTARSNADLVGVYTAETNNTEGAITGVREAKKDGQDLDRRLRHVRSDRPGARGRQDHGLIVQYPFGEGQKGIETLVKADRRRQGRAQPDRAVRGRHARERRRSRRCSSTSTSSTARWRRTSVSRRRRRTEGRRRGRPFGRCASRPRPTTRSRSRARRSRDIKADDQGERVQPMRGFEDTYVDIVDYIIRITHRIWEDQDVGYIYDTYAPAAASTTTAARSTASSGWSRARCSRSTPSPTCATTPTTSSGRATRTRASSPRTARSTSATTSAPGAGASRPAARSTAG